MTIESRSLDSLRSHPENVAIFGDPEECPQWESVLASIRKRGIMEPLAVKADGTIMSGHLRAAAAHALKMATVPARIVGPFESYRDELEFLIRSNTDRRQLTKGEIALAFKRLRETPRADGGTKGKAGRPKKGENPPANRGISKDAAADEAAEILGVGRDEARALEAVFTTPGVPDEMKRAVNTGKLAPTPAAKAVRVEAKRQGGEIKDPAALRIVAEVPKKREPIATPGESDHDRRVADEAARYQRDYRDLFEVYKQLDSILTRRPLKSVIGPTEHHEFAGLVRDVALRAWREIEAVQGTTNAGRQMTLTVIDGGAK